MRLDRAGQGEATPRILRGVVDSIQGHLIEEPLGPRVILVPVGEIVMSSLREVEKVKLFTCFYGLLSSILVLSVVTHAAKGPIGDGALLHQLCGWDVLALHGQKQNKDDER